jgi:hypothetical protein
MEEATRLYSSKGFFAETIRAIEIRSRPDARKLGPFVHDHRLVLWVNRAYYEDGNLMRQAHFRRYPKNSSAPRDIVKGEIEERHISVQKSNKHEKAQKHIAIALEELKNNGLHLPWFFRDSRSSDFPLSGDLMADVESVETEYKLKTPFHVEYRLDIALLGPKIKNKKVVLAAIEIEHSHQFECSKALICKTLGFPLISLDISETQESEITLEWARKALMETKYTSEDNRRRNYIYLHPMLYSVYLDFPKDMFRENRHQFVVFCKNEIFEELYTLIRKLVSSLHIDPNRINIAPVRDKNEQTKKQVQNAGPIAGENYRDYSEHQFIQVSVDRPPAKSGPLYIFHLVLAQLCNSIYPSLVGYKYELGHVYMGGEDPHWTTTRQVDGELRKLLVAPMRVSEPIDEIIRVMSSLEK